MYKTLFKREKLSIKTGIKIATKLLKGSVIFVMKNLSKQVVILDNISSPYIHQAIIILKNYAPQHHEKIIAEAEKVVSEYFNKNSPQNSTYNIGRKSNFGLKCTVAFLSIALIISTFANFLK